VSTCLKVVDTRRALPDPKSFHEKAGMSQVCFSVFLFFFL